MTFSIVRRVAYALMLLLGACMSALGTPEVAQAQCPFAPVQPGPCKYVDPKLFNVLIQTAAQEAMRWALLDGMQGGLAGFDRRMGVSRLLVTRYDSSLNAVSTPRVSVRQAFAAAFNVVMGSNVQLVVTGDQTRVVNVGALVNQEQTTLATQHTDPAMVMAGNLQRFGTTFVSGESGAGVALELAAILTATRAAETRDTALITAANTRAVAVRRDTGEVGDAQGMISATQARLDHLRTMQEEVRLDGIDARLATVEHAQAARQGGLYQRALRQWAQAQGTSW